MKYGLNFYKKKWVIIGLGLYSFHMQSQDTPIGNKIVGNGDPLNYYIGHFPVSGSDGLDLHWYGGIRFGDRTGNSIMQVSNGNVGIGTTSPMQKFVVSNGAAEGLEVYLGQPTGTVGLQVYNRSTSQYNKMAFAASQYNFDGGNVGIGTTNPSNDQGWNKVLDVAGSDHAKILVTADNSNFRTGIFTHTTWHGGGGFMGTESNHNLFLMVGYDPKVTIQTNGNVGIGTKSPDSKLTVNGNIHAKEVKIDLSIPAPDYVFTKEYKLKTLQEVEEYIKQNKHLPEIPSAQELDKNGLMLAEMNMSLLKKVEELTLYMIEMKKENEKIKTDNEKQNEEIKNLLTLLSSKK